MGEKIGVDQAGTLSGLFRIRVERSANGTAYRYYDSMDQHWRSRSWSDMARLVARWQAAILREGLEAGDRVAIMLPNGPDWVAVDQAVLGLDMVVVPLYINDRGANIAYILNDCTAKLLVVAGDDQWAEMRDEVKGCGHLQRVVSLNYVSYPESRVVQAGEWLGDVGAKIRYATVSGDTLATIVYTSGTTGRPKGVMLSHRNILTNAYASSICADVVANDLFLSFLPLSHTLERTVGYYLPMIIGAEVAYARSIPLLGEDLIQIKPTVIVSVPRIYERVYGRITEQMNNRPPLAQKLFSLAVEIGWQRLLHLQGRAGWRISFVLWPLLKRLVADKVMARLGGRIRVAVCGGAPLSEKIAQMFIALGLPLLNGYGMTEASPVVCVNRPDDNYPESVGKVLDQVEVRLGNDDELLVNSPGVMLGYWRQDEATRETVDSDGWLHTGDKAAIDAEGHIRITGRLKEIIVLSNGEKVPPSDMELAITMDPLIEQALVFGERRPYLTALIVPEPEHWKAFCADRGMTGAEALGSAAVREHFLERVSSRIRAFPGYAQVRRLAICPESWSVENDLLTPTLKLRRNLIQERYKNMIEALYEGH